MIAIDWGSSSLRVFRLSEHGEVLDTRRSAQGVLACAGRFEETLREQTEGWDDCLVLMCGMIGSRQGWQEVPYVECPTGLPEIAAGMVPLPASTSSERELWIVPGLCVRNDDGTRDVMRGEETQICGLMDTMQAGTHWICLPGTHSKLATVADGRIQRFVTAMTGEMYDLLCRHSILGKLMQPGDHDPVAFNRGLDDAARGRGLLQQLFAVRTHGLFGELQPSELPSYLSGLLIGHELDGLPSATKTVSLVAAPSLARPYVDALIKRGCDVRTQPEWIAAKGLHTLAGIRGLRMHAT